MFIYLVHLLLTLGFVLAFGDVSSQLPAPDSDVSQKTFLSGVKLKCITVRLLSFHPVYPGFSIRDLIASLWVMGHFCR